MENNQREPKNAETKEGKEKPVAKKATQKKVTKKKAQKKHAAKKKVARRGRPKGSRNKKLATKKGRHARAKYLKVQVSPMFLKIASQMDMPTEDFLLMCASNGLSATIERRIKMFERIKKSYL